MTTLSAEEFLDSSDGLIIDVRSPSEYGRGHIPGAHSLPLFTDEERAAVGICYKEEGHQAALLLGLDLVGPKLGNLVRTAQELSASQKRLRLYCFRGGQRSQSMAWLLAQGGFEISLLEGGYKAYRRCVLRAFSNEQNILVLSGCTGSGKTSLLGQLSKQGEQVLDLEGIACHRGSAFGGYHQPVDLSTEMFENRLHQVWQNLDRHQRVWIEDEGRTLGRLHIPEGLWSQMRAAPVVFLDIPQAERVKHLVTEYGDYDKALLGQSLTRISRRLGNEVYQLSQEALDKGELENVARYCLNYYDRAYLHCLEKRSPSPYRELSLGTVDMVQNSKALLEALAHGLFEEIPS